MNLEDFSPEPPDKNLVLYFDFSLEDPTTLSQIFDIQNCELIHGDILNHRVNGHCYAAIN